MKNTTLINKKKKRKKIYNYEFYETFMLIKLFSF